MDFIVLILGTDANAYYMARCCYEAYHKKAYVIGKDRLAFTKFSNILHVSYEEDLWKEEGFLKTLKKFAQQHKNQKILLISTNETYVEFISKNKEKLSKQYVFNYPSIEIIKSLTNKENFYKTYEKSVLKFPKTFYYDVKKNTKIPKMDYPCILKCANVVEYNHIKFNGKNKIYKIETEEELKKTIALIKESGYKDKLILQEFIPGDDSYLFDAVVYVKTKGKVEFVSFAQIGLQEHTKSMIGNAAVLINGFNTTKGDILKMSEDIRSFMEKIHYTGFAEVDMKYDSRDNCFKVLEINARQGRCSYYVTLLDKNLVQVLAEDVLFHQEKPYTFLTDKVLLSFVPKGIVKKYIKNEEFKKEALKMWKNVVKPMSAKVDKNFKRFLLLHKRWFHYYKEYKNGYWK